jgi:hypothetical protein
MTNYISEQPELNDQEFACLIMRSCGVSNIIATLGANHANSCGFCQGVKKVA